MNGTTIQIRLKELMEYFGITQADICRKTGISTSLMGYYCTGQRCPKQKNIKIIAEAYNVNPEWLIGQDVPMDVGKAESISEMIMYFNKLTESEQKTVISLLKYMVGE